MGDTCLEGFLEEICSSWKEKVGNPAVKSLGKSRVGWGCQQVHVSWGQDFSNCQLGRGAVVLEWQSTESRPGAGQETDLPGMNWSGWCHSFSL